MTDVLLATCAALPRGEPGASALDEALSGRGLTAEWVRWDDDGVDWGATALVAIRSTWDYVERRSDFLRWTRDVERRTCLLNGSSAFAWNTDKQYLVELGAAGVPIVPSISVDTHADLVPAAAGFDSAVVVKPRVGVGGIGLVEADDADDLAEHDVGPGPWLVQPVVHSIATEGELSLFVIDGRVVSAVQKIPAAGGLLVHEAYGGRTVSAAVDEEAATLALSCVDTAEGLLSTTLHYARVDLLRHEGELVVSELEATEPGLYLDVIPENAVPFADLVLRLLGQGSSVVHKP
ncbi:MAG TPA: hypothetical protein VFK52_02435 [Nocardioidaceae bacterium]|nr:hypothetical protein [Nocardioidaceae bacterium]